MLNCNPSHGATSALLTAVTPTPSSPYVYTSMSILCCFRTHIKRPLTPKSRPSTNDEHAKLKAWAPKQPLIINFIFSIIIKLVVKNNKHTPLVLPHNRACGDEITS